MKKLFAAIIAFALTLPLAACDGGNVNSGNQTETSVKNSNSKVLPVEVKEFGYSMEDEYLYYSVILHNPNEDTAIEFPSFRITARDGSGAVLATDEEVLSIIYPQQDFVHAFQAFDVDELPATVDIEVLDAREYNIRKVSTLDNPEYAPLSIINASFRTDSIVGEIQNDNDYDIESGVVTVVFRDDDGKLIGGNSTYVSSIKANSATPFDMLIYNDFATDDYEIYANIG